MIGSFLRKHLSKGKPPRGSGKADLTDDERAIAKYLFDDGWSGQDILSALNIGRQYSINSGRLTAVKKDKTQLPCSDEEIGRFFRVKEAFDLRTGLNPFKDERLIRAREAMITAVHIFNSPSFKFKSEQFAVMSNIAWTYLCHEKILREGFSILKDNGNTLALSEMVANPSINLSEAVKGNRNDVKLLRDKVEHHLLEQADVLWRGLFQANCINFDNTMCSWFGDELSLANELNFSLQFSKVNLEQLKQLSYFDVPPSMEALNQEMKKSKTPEIVENPEYELKVVYTFNGATKGDAHIQFVSPDSAAGVEISNVLIKERVGDQLYPFKPNVVARMVTKALGSKFSNHDHTLAWKKHKVRPVGIDPKPGTVQAKYCCYHSAHKDYTYNQAWVDKLIEDFS